MSEGWFKVKFGITRHPLFKKRPDRLAIWMWLLDNACWKDTPHDVRGQTVTVPRGSVCVSERRIADETGVSYQAVRTFLRRLIDERMINADPNAGRNVITLCNYEKYQLPQKGANAPSTQELTHHQRTKEEDIPISSLRSDIGRRDAPPENGVVELDPIKVLFDTGIRSLGRANVPEERARQMLGKWRRDYGVDPVMKALAAASREGAVHPISFIEACLGQAKKQADKPKYGDTRINKFTGHQEVWMGGIDGWMRENVSG